MTSWSSRGRTQQEVAGPPSDLWVPRIPSNGVGNGLGLVTVGPVHRRSVDSPPAQECRQNWAGHVDKTATVRGVRPAQGGGSGLVPRQIASAPVFGVHGGSALQPSGRDGRSGPVSNAEGRPLSQAAVAGSGVGTPLNGDIRGGSFGSHWSPPEGACGTCRQPLNSGRCRHRADRSGDE